MAIGFDKLEYFAFNFKLYQRKLIFILSGCCFQKLLKHSIKTAPDIFTASF